MFYFHKVAYVQYLGEVDIFHTWVKEFSPLYNSAKIIKIDRYFLKLWSQMYYHLLWFTVYMRLMNTHYVQVYVCKLINTLSISSNKTRIDKYS